MYIALNKKSILFFGSILCVILSNRLFSIDFFSSYRNEITYASWGVALALSLFLYKEINELRTRYTYLNFFYFYILISQFIICVYSMYTYDENILDMFICAGGYLLLLFAYILLIGMEQYGAENFLHIFYVISVTYMLILLINAVLENHIGVSFLTIDASSKTGLMRMSVGSLYMVMMILVFWKITVKESTKIDVFIFVSGIVLELYVHQTRNTQISLFLSFFFMWIFQKQKTDIKLAQILISIVFSIALFALGIHREVINSFSIDPSVNPNYTSSLARLNAIDYFKDYFITNPLIGMGWVRPKNDYLRLIFSGPNHRAFFDDLGFLGQLFRQGILGVLIYLLFITRLMFIGKKLPECSKYKNLVIGIIVYILISAISQNCFDGQRILGVSFFIAVSEMIYIKEKDKSNYNVSLYKGGISGKKV